MGILPLLRIVRATAQKVRQDSRAESAITCACNVLGRIPAVIFGQPMLEHINESNSIRLHTPVFAAFVILINTPQTGSWRIYKDNVCHINEPILIINRLRIRANTLFEGGIHHLGSPHGQRCGRVSGTAAVVEDQRSIVLTVHILSQIGVKEEGRLRLLHSYQIQTAVISPSFAYLFRRELMSRSR